MMKRMICRHHVIMIYEAARLQSLDINRVDWFSRRSNRFYSAFQLKSDFSIHPISTRIHPKLATFVGVVTTLWWCSYSDSLLLWLSCHVMRKVSEFLFYLQFDQCLQLSIWPTVFPSNSLFTLQSSCGLTQSLTQKPFRGKTNCANNSLDRAIWVRDDSTC